MAKTKTVNRAKEQDSVYFLKIVLYLILGSLWLRIQKGNTTLPLPIGFAVGLIFASKERFQLDRKIELALLLVAMFIAFWLPIGLVVSL